MTITQNPAPEAKKGMSLKKKLIIGGSAGFVAAGIFGALASPPAPTPDGADKPVVQEQTEQPKSDEQTKMEDATKDAKEGNTTEAPTPEPEPVETTDPEEFKLSSSLEFDFLASSMERYPVLTDMDAQAILDAGYTACAQMKDGASQQEAALYASDLPEGFIYYATGYMCYDLTD